MNECARKNLAKIPEGQTDGSNDEVFMRYRRSLKKIFITI